MTKTVHLSIHSEVFRIAPHYRRYVFVGMADDAVVRDIDFGEEIATLAMSFSSDPESAISAAPLELWRSSFRAAGINPTKFRPSVDALVRRAAAGTPPVLGQKFVDAGTVATLTYVAPIGVHVLDDITDHGSLVLRPADSDDRFVAFDGSVETPDAGEIVYVDGDHHVLTRRWVWRQGRLGSVEPSSSQFAVNVDLIDPSLYGEGVVKELLEFFAQVGLTNLEVLQLDSEHPSATATIDRVH